jgi:hypothetical protein
MASWSYLEAGSCLTLLLCSDGQLVLCHLKLVNQPGLLTGQLVQAGLEYLVLGEQVCELRRRF